MERPYLLSAVQPRRIVATASRWRRRDRIVAVVFGVWFVVVAVTINVLREVLDLAAAKTASGGMFIGACAVLVVFLLYAYGTKPLVVDVRPDGVALDDGRRGVFPLQGVRAGEWRRREAQRRHFGQAIPRSGDRRAPHPARYFSET